MAAPPSQRITTTGGFSVGTNYIPQNIRSDDQDAWRRWDLERMCMGALGRVDQPMTGGIPIQARA